MVSPKYEVLELIEKGGMSKVYKARNRMTSKLVALKLLEISHENQARWLREKTTLGLLQHPNIVELIEADKNDKSLVLVMEYLQGKSLQEAIRKNIGFPVEVALSVLESICVPLAFMHKRGFIHCDLKPSNIFLAHQNENIHVIKLLDFGLCQQAFKKSKPMGSAGFASPEQIRGEHLTPASDVYALGALLVFMLTGRRLFEGTPSEIIKQQLNGYSSLGENEKIPIELQVLIQRALHKDAQQRFRGASELLLLLGL